ncbi:hypothetical protein PT974_06520 [Cladobotryum mycophilum]|uniref:CFEM domain-containing protein n=1 Tax=Cladobotryum mycophilum TaxID=491253 RepID=A0ABR0SMH8_9HYPO
MLKFWTVALMALAIIPQASSSQESSALQAISQMPQCARNCLEEVIPRSSCQPTNHTCMCENPAMKQEMSICLTASCTIKETLLTLNLTAIGCNAPVRDRSQQYVNISNAFGIISAAFVIERFAYKIWAGMNLGWDDWMTLLTIVSGVPSTIINAYGVTKNGLGRDIWTLQPSTITNFTRYFFIIEIIYFSEVAMLKLALLFFYVRIFPSRWVQRLLWSTIVICIMFGVTFVVVAVFQCTPIHYYWVRWDGEHKGKCMDINAIAWSNAGISIGLDVWMLAVPLWQLRDLNLDWRRKVGVAMMFCVGTFVTVVSILRLRSLVKFGSNSLNPTWDFFDAGLWSTIEINVGLICVCLPSLRLLLVRLFPKLQSTSQRHYDNYSSTNNQSNSKKRGSRPPLGNHVSSKVDRSVHRPEVEPNRIAYHTSYSVEYCEPDEIQLVSMKENDIKSARSDTS